jgi:hypothetical protein
LLNSLSTKDWSRGPCTVVVARAARRGAAQFSALKRPSRRPSAYIQKGNLRGTDKLTLCAGGWSLGIKGVGEIGIVGVAAAIASAVYHTTGKRVRNLPIRLDKLQRWTELRSG